MSVKVTVEEGTESINDFFASNNSYDFFNSNHGIDLDKYNEVMKRYIFTNIPNKELYAKINHVVVPIEYKDMGDYNNNEPGVYVIDFYKFHKSDMTKLKNVIRYYIKKNIEKNEHIVKDIKDALVTMGKDTMSPISNLKIVTFFSYIDLIEGKTLKHDDIVVTTSIDHIDNIYHATKKHEGHIELHVDYVSSKGIPKTIRLHKGIYKLFPRKEGDKEAINIKIIHNGSEISEDIMEVDNNDTITFDTNKSDKYNIPEETLELMKFREEQKINNDRARLAKIELAVKERLSGIKFSEALIKLENIHKVTEDNSIKNVLETMKILKGII